MIRKILSCINKLMSSGRGWVCEIFFLIIVISLFIQKFAAVSYTHLQLMIIYNGANDVILQALNEQLNGE